MKQPKVIFFDAVGTLFGIKGSVGQVYSDVAQRFGVQASAETLNKTFLASFQTAPPPIFPGAKPEEIPECEFEWWQLIAFRTFQQAGISEQFSNFAAFFAELYNHFATAEPWFVYPDVRSTLERCHQMGIELGIVSNFDSRLYRVLEALTLSPFFSSVTISTEVGAAKPNPEIFTAGLNKHNCPPEAAWHVGDNLQEDYQGAKAVGLRGILLKRSLKENVAEPDRDKQTE